GNQGIDELSLEVALQVNQVVKAAAEGQRRSAKRRGLHELTDDGAKPRDVRKGLVQLYPGLTMKRNLGVGQDEARHPGLVDQGELASNPAACVIPDQCI